MILCSVVSCVSYFVMDVFFVKQKTAYERRISDWSSDVCSSDLKDVMVERIDDLKGLSKTHPGMAMALAIFMFSMAGIPPLVGFFAKFYIFLAAIEVGLYVLAVVGVLTSVIGAFRSEEHTSELQSLMRISYAGFCFKKKNPPNRAILIN